MFNQPEFGKARATSSSSGPATIRRSRRSPLQDALVNVSGPMATIHPATLLEPRAGYYVEIAAAAFEDLSGHPFAGISGPEGWDFTTVGPLVSDDAVTAQEDTPSNLDVLSNDLGIGRPVDPATLAIVAGPTQGTVAVHNGLVIYTPAANFAGQRHVSLHRPRRGRVRVRSGHGDDHGHRGARLPESGPAPRTSTARGRSRHWTS